MSSLHEHWQITDEEQPVPIRSTSSRPIAPASTKSVSRTPAAVVGMVLTVALGYYLVQNGSGIQGQVAEDAPLEPAIFITVNGFDPATYRARPGETILVKNDDQIPHILRADTLPTDDDLPYESSPLFPGDTTEILLPVTAAAGTYEYYSTTAEFSGEIMVDPTLPAPASSSVSSVSFESSESSSSFSSSSSSLPPPPSSSSSSSPAPAPVSSASGALPQNPYTVGSGDAPLPPRPMPGGQPSASVTQHSPIMQPETGIETWILGLIGMLALCGTLRMAMR